MHSNREPKNIGVLNTEKRLYNLDPPYQRETGIWSLEKKQLFIDSIINGFDIPKIYIHDLGKPDNDGYHYAVIDGKQRLTAIWEFMNNEFALSSDFEFSKDAVPGNVLDEESHPGKNQNYSDFDEKFKEYFKNRSLDFVKVGTEEEDEIDEQFSRLNNGEPLNTAEKRNAFGGSMNKLIRELSKHRFFERKVKFKNKRFCYYEVAVKLLRLEHHDFHQSQILCDLSKKHLDDLVKNNKEIDNQTAELLRDRVNKQLDISCKIFDDEDFLLRKQTYPQIYYVFVKKMFRQYTSETKMEKLLKGFLTSFETDRIKNTRQEDKNPDFENYNLHAMQGTNSYQGMEVRIGILTDYFVKWHGSDLSPKDLRRNYNDKEREYVWITNNKTCQKCGNSVTLDEMDVDHIKKWKDGGSTTLANARCLCIRCNRGDTN